MNNLSHTGGDGADASELTVTRRRRLPHPDEQKRRQAWGREWGDVMRAHAKQKGWK